MNMIFARNPNHISMGAAQTLLENAGLAEFEEPVYFPMENKSMAILKPAENENNNVDINDLIELYPNPADDKLWIEYIIFNDNTAKEVFIYDIKGRLVLTQKVRNGFGVEQIDVSKLSPGSYILKFGKYSKQFSKIN